MAPQDDEIERAFRQESLLKEQAGRPRMRATQVHVRLGQRFVSVWWFLPVIVVAAAAVIVAAKLYWSSAAGQSFVTTHSCSPTQSKFAGGVPAWTIATHAFNFFLLVMIVRAGLQILADHPRLYLRVHSTPGREWLRFRGPVPEGRVWTAKQDAITLTPLVGLPGGRHTIGVARHWHFLFDIVFVLNGVVYIALLFATGYWHKIVPTDWSILPRTGSCVVTYASLHLPTGDSGFRSYDALQQVSYFGVVFLLAPLAILTGLAMSPALDNRFKAYQRLFGNRQAARSLHFATMVAFVAFYAVHMLMVAATGLSKNLNRMTLGRNVVDLNGVALFLLALAITLGFNVWAVRVSWTHTRVLQRISGATVGRVMDLLFDHYAPRAEYSREEISPHFWPNGLVPTDPTWCELRDGGFDDYRLKVSGLVERPAELSLEDMREMARREQVTMHNCIQGWSGIAAWDGLPFEALIEHVRPHPEARYAMFYSYGEGGEGGEYYDSHTMRDLHHAQSLLAYEMNGETLPIEHGAPLRLRVENQLGFKHVKWIREIEFVHDYRDHRGGHGGYNEDHEFYGYRNEI